MAKDEQRYIIRSVSRALELLKTFPGAQSELSLAEISRRLNLNRSTTFRLLVTLQAHGYVEQDQETRKYRLGVTCFESGSVFLNQSDMESRGLEERRVAIIDVSRLEAQPREHSDNKHIVRRDDLKISLVSVRPSEEIPIHLHEEGEQFYYVLEGVLSLGGEIYQPRPG